MRCSLVASFIIILYSLCCENVFLNANPVRSPPLTDEDKDTIGILKLWGTSKIYGLLQEQNVTLYTIAKSIVDHKIADNKTLQWAEVITEDWDPDFSRISDDALSRLPVQPKYILKRFYETYLSEKITERRTQFNTWTNGEFEIIFKAYHNKVTALQKEFEDMMNKSVEKLSDNTKDFYRTSIEESNNPDKKRAVLAKSRLFDILVKNIYF